MLNYSERFEDIKAENSVFAGANTPRGFEGDYANIISEDSFERLYLVKGGAGTGKSTLMKACANAASEKGARLTYIRCSSDPDSLDGVIMEKDEKKFAILDATAPHVMDCRYPGACSEIIDCGAFWNSQYLEQRRDEIMGFTKNKLTSYERAYRYLKAAGEIFDIQQRIAKYVLIWDKMEKAVKRLCDTLKGEGEKGKVLYRRTQCISMKGAYRLTTFENESDLYAVKDYSFLSPLFFEMLKQELLNREFLIEVSLSPLFGICEIRVHDAKCSFVPFKKDKDFCKCVNLSRFANAQKVRAVKQRRMFTVSCLGTVLDGALESLSDAGREHFKLEKIYKEAMDFNSLSDETRRLCEKIALRI